MMENPSMDERIEKGILHSVKESAELNHIKIHGLAIARDHYDPFAPNKLVVDAGVFPLRKQHSFDIPVIEGPWEFKDFIAHVITSIMPNKGRKRASLRRTNQRFGPRRIGPLNPWTS